jgi:beta-lactamase class A
MSSRHHQFIAGVCALLCVVTMTVSTIGLSAANAQQASPESSPASQIPDTPIGQQLTWLLGAMNGNPDEITADIVTQHFAPEFLQQVPAAQLVPILKQTAMAYAPFVLTGFASPPTDTQASALVQSHSGQMLSVQIAVTPDAPHQIIGLLFQPAPAASGTPKAQMSWSDFDQQWSKAAAMTSFLAAEVIDQGCQPLHALNADQPLAIGSAFKLYVLGALAQEVKAGNATWDQQLAIHDEWKSLPSGTFQLVPAGTNFSLQAYAQQMISISDNTATDHLIHLLGADTVAHAVTTMGSSHADMNTPFLTTRQLFALKLAAPDELVRQYVNGNADEREALLSGPIAKLQVDPTKVSAWTEPKEIEQLEWFASANDLCAAMQSLHQMSQQPGLEPVAEVLSVNPGISLDDHTWKAVQFKGGSEPGVLNLTWLLQRDDGRWFVVTGTLNDTHNTVSEVAALGLMQSAIGVVGSAS